MRARTHIVPMIVAAAALVATALTSCQTVSFETPDGFAQFEAEQSPRAISPEGVVLRMRTVPNEPVQDLEFWSEALERQMIDSGYLLLETDTFASPQVDGTWFEWLAPVNGEDWVYLTGIAVHDDRIVIAEAAGPIGLYRQRRTAVIESLSSISVP